MSNITVRNISGLSSSSVHFPDGIAGDGLAMSFSPEVLSFSPVPNYIDVDQNTNINIVFDQPIQFSLTDPGVIQLRSNSASGTVIESFNTQNPGSQLTITTTNVAEDTLIINPVNQLPNDTNVFVVIPNVGIANTFGGLYKGTDKYSFKTLKAPLNATGGTYAYSVSDGSSPTGYYKYHVFVGTGSLNMNVPMKSCPTFNLLCVAGGGSGGPGYSPTYVGGGGGGAGGVISGSKSQLSEIPAGNYIITIGGGGTNNPYSESYPGNPSSFGDLFEAIGGGAGGNGPNPYARLLGGDGGSGGGGAGTNYYYDALLQYNHPNSFPQRGHAVYAGGRGGAGQGNPGGQGYKGYTDPQPQRGAGGGGGGAGGSGTNAPGPSYGPSTGHPYPQYGTPLFRGNGGPGGPGRAEPVFRSPAIMPGAPGLPTKWQSEVGPSGYYGGGGGGGCPNQAYYLHAGDGGAGGGGHGSHNNWPPPNYPPGSYHPNNFNPTFPTEPQRAEDGTEFTGGGGGGSGATHYSTYPGGAGGSGIVIIRYSIPSTLA